MGNRSLSRAASGLAGLRRLVSTAKWDPYLAFCMRTDALGGGGDACACDLAVAFVGRSTMVIVDSHYAYCADHIN